MIDLPPLWTSQARSIELVIDAISNGERRICLCHPTGGGKMRIACELIRDWLHVDYKVILYTNRKMLIEQLSSVLSNFGLQHGLRTASDIEHGKMPSEHPLQISSIQTEAWRTLKKKVWQLHKADRVLIDEAHINAGETAKTLLEMHVGQGAHYVGLTATPLALGHLYDHLIVGATNSELRECGALVPASHYGPDEPDVQNIGKAEWQYTENDVRKVMKVHKIFGRVLDWFNILNPLRRPTILFAPGVPESIWFAEEFAKRGIEAAHIDGRTCFYKGKRHDSNKEIRQEILRASKAGEVVVLCNRFVLREGIDAPWLAHGIFATIFTSLQSYLQSGGRLLRAFPGMESVTIQDHGGNWWRHGSLNANRIWELDYTEAIVQGMRQEELRGKSQREPIRCPKCAKIILTNKCSCGFEVTKKSRPVIMEDGSLKEHGGDIFKPRRVNNRHDTEAIWKRIYYRSRNAKRTFRQAEGLFVYENGYWPPRDLPLMPKNERDWYRRVSDVPKDNLI